MEKSVVDENSDGTFFPENPKKCSPGPQAPSPALELV
jgi:hypothetical protein